MWSYSLRCRLQKRPHLLNIPNFFGVVTLNTRIFLFGPTKHAKHFEKMAELTYAEKYSYFCSAFDKRIHIQP